MKTTPVKWMLCLSILSTNVIPAVEAGDPLPEGWHVDRSLYPKAYGILDNQKLMEPVDMSDWPAKIDGTRQLFVDDCLVAKMENLQRELHHPVKHPENPLLVGDKPWEGATDEGVGGVVFQIVRRDEESGLFRMWYAGYVPYKLSSGVRVRFPGLYAESKDGIVWEKPNLGLHEFKGSKENNIVLPAGNLFGLIVEPNDPNPNRRYKGIVWHEPPYVPREGYFLYTSPDGIHWTRETQDPIALSLNGYTMPQSGIGDTSIFRWDSHLEKYVCDSKFVLPGKFRCRGIMESDDLWHWSPPRMTLYPDSLDHPDSQVYGHLSFCYESMWLGFLRMMHTHVGWKQTTCELTCSRDGRNWSRAGERGEFLTLGTRDEWDADYHDACWDPIRVDDELWIYYRSLNRQPTEKTPKVGHAIGLAKLRRDGFVSLNAGEEIGSVTTRPLTFTGARLHVNAEVANGGAIRAALLTRASEPVSGYGLEDCTPLQAGGLDVPVSWGTGNQLPPPEEGPARFVFELKNAKVYSFWVD